MQTIYRFLLIVFLLNTFVITQVFSSDNDTLDTKTTSANKGYYILQLQKQSRHSFNIEANYPMADSLAYLAYVESQLMGDDDLVFSSLINYCAVAYIDVKAQRALSSAQEAEDMVRPEMDKEKTFKAIYQHARILLQTKEYREAQDYLMKAENLPGENKPMKILFNLLMGEIMERQLQKVNAFQNYTNAVYLSSEIENDSLLYESYRKMYKFYSVNDNYTKAREYYLKADFLVEHSSHFDKHEKLWNKVELVNIYRNAKQIDISISLAYRVIEEARRMGYQSAKEYCMSSLRALLLDNNRFQEISDYYSVKYPEELELLRISAPRSYNRVMSIVMEVRGQIDSAKYYMKQAEIMVACSTDPDYKANFYKRMGEFYLRHEAIDSASESLEKSATFGINAADLSFVIGSSHLLDSLYNIRHDPERAYYYLKLNQHYADSNTVQMQHDKIALSEVEHKGELNKLFNEKEQYRSQQKHNLQLFITILSIFLALIILVFLSNSALPKWVIKAFGFLTFIFLFEFIIYIADTFIHHLTHGDLLPLMAFKIVLISFLLPLHHWIEDKIVHYLISHKFLHNMHFSFRNMFKGFIAKESLLVLENHPDKDDTAGSE